MTVYTCMYSQAHRGPHSTKALVNALLYFKTILDSDLCSACIYQADGMGELYHT